MRGAANQCRFLLGGGAFAAGDRATHAIPGDAGPKLGEFVGGVAAAEEVEDAVKFAASGLARDLLTTADRSMRYSARRNCARVTGSTGMSGG